MPVYPAGFSERVFEFSFNAEYAHVNKALLAAAPYIPTQNEEKFLGYDVEFELKRHGVFHSLALQHKVSRRVDNSSRSNAHFWSAAGGPYFAFRVDVDQYNLIHDVASSGLPGVEFYYCAPLFADRASLNSNYVHRRVRTQSVWIDVKDSGAIAHGEPHSIVYSVDGLRAALFSKDPVKLQTLKIQEYEERRRVHNERLTVPQLRYAYETAFDVVKNYWPKRRVRRRGSPDEFDLPRSPPVRRATKTFEETVFATRELLSEYYGLTWLVELAS
jgi:hypothetical protein